MLEEQKKPAHSVVTPSADSQKSQQGWRLTLLNPHFPVLPAALLSCCTKLRKIDGKLCGLRSSGKVLQVQAPRPKILGLNSSFLTRATRGQALGKHVFRFIQALVRVAPMDSYECTALHKSLLHESLLLVIRYHTHLLQKRPPDMGLLSR